MKGLWLAVRLAVLVLLVCWVGQSIAQTLASDAPPEQKLWEIMLKAIFPPLWTALSPMLTGAISRFVVTLSPTFRYILSTVIGTATGALAGTVDAFPLTSESAANMGGTAGLTGQWLAERNPSLFGGTATQAAKTVPVVLLVCLMTGCVSVSAKVCTPESITALVPESWPSTLKKACPVDFNYSNMTPESPKQTLRVIVPASQEETPAPMPPLPRSQATPMYEGHELLFPVGPYEGDHMTLECRSCATLTPNVTLPNAMGTITPGEGSTFLLGPGVHDGH